MATWSTDDQYGTKMVIVASPGGPVSLHIEPGGETWHGTPEQAEDARSKWGAAIGVARGSAGETS